MKKIFYLSEFSKIIKKLKKNYSNIVLCHGVFDLFHLGHLKYLKEAKNNCDCLVVSVTVDKYVNKGIGRPVFNHHQRAELLSSLNIVDFVLFSEESDAVKVINLVKPKYYAKGIEYKNHKKDSSGNIKKEISAIKKNKGKIIYINEQVFSSSEFINKSNYLFNDEQKSFLKKLKSNYSFDEISKYIDKFNNVKTLVIGETIIDEYVYSRPLGKSGKEPYLAFNELYKKTFLGGAAAVACQINSFAKKTSFISVIGKKKEFLQFIKKKISNNINCFFLERNFSNTIVKKRYIDEVSNNKVFGSYIINTDDITKYDEIKLIDKIKSQKKNFDMVIISDYGHGFITNKIAKYISSSNKFLALNAQVNAANIGFHSLKKYNKINTVIINETELRHELRNRHKKTEELAKKLLTINNIKNLIVTMGSAGSFIISENKNSVYCPAFANKVVDKVGAGDSMLSIVALCLKLKIPNDIAIFLASVMAAYSVENIASNKIVDKVELKRTIEFMYK